MSPRRDASREEGELFDEVRSGSSRAFRLLVAAHDPPMRRVATLYPGADVDGVVCRAWATAVRGLDMFTWHTTLRAWLLGILMSTARPRAVPRQPLPTPPPHPAEGQVPWRTLAWSRQWGPHGWQSLEAAWSRLPLADQEVVWLVDVEEWPLDEACQAVALTTADGRSAVSRTRSRLADAVARHLGQHPDPDERTRQERGEAVATLLSSWRDLDVGSSSEALLLRDFRAWRRELGLRPWSRRRSHRGRSRPPP